LRITTGYAFALMHPGSLAKFPKAQQQRHWTTKQQRQSKMIQFTAPGKNTDICSMDRPKPFFFNQRHPPPDNDNRGMDNQPADTPYRTTVHHLRFPSTFFTMTLSMVIENCLNKARMMLKHHKLIAQARHHSMLARSPSAPSSPVSPDDQQLTRQQVIDLENVGYAIKSGLSRYR
jgi:hypothetical protein